MSFNCQNNTEWKELLNEARELPTEILENRLEHYYRIREYPFSIRLMLHYSEEMFGRTNLGHYTAAEKVLMERHEVRESYKA